MENSKRKVIFILVIIFIVAGYFGIRYYQEWSQNNMIKAVQKQAETSGLKDVSIEINSYNKHKLFLTCSNFESMEWDSLFLMHEKIMNIRGVDEVIYVKSNGFDSDGWRHYDIILVNNTIESYNSDGHIDYFGSWDNSKKSTYGSISQIRASLESRNNTGNSNTSDRATDAKICAVKAVKDNLKSPSTAKFCKYTEMTATNLGGNEWKVSGYVDAQNSFGATMREHWVVTLMLTGSGFKDYTVTFN